MNKKKQQQAWQQWLSELNDPASTLAVEETAHDHLPGTWRIDGMRLDTHINWFLLNVGIQGQFDGVMQQAPAGSWVCLPPQTPIHFRAQDPSKPIHMMRFRLRLERDGKVVPLPEPGFILHDASAMRPLVAQLLNCAETRDAWSVARRRGLLLAMYAEAMRLQQQQPSGVRELNAAQLEQCDALIAQYLPDSMPPVALAEALQMKPDTFARSFKRSRGKSPRAWIAERRIRHAAELLLMPDVNVSQVADDCLYADVFHFSKQFSRVMGCSPRAWQQRHSH